MSEDIARRAACNMLGLELKLFFRTGTTNQTKKTQRTQLQQPEREERYVIWTPGARVGVGVSSLQPRDATTTVVTSGDRHERPII